MRFTLTKHNVQSDRHDGLTKQEDFLKARSEREKQLDKAKPIVMKVGASLTITSPKQVTDCSLEHLEVHNEAASDLHSAGKLTTSFLTAPHKRLSTLPLFRQCGRCHLSLSIKQSPEAKLSVVETHSIRIFASERSRL